MNEPGLFLDRDGTINEDRGYVGSRDQWEWVPGAKDAVRAATEAGWRVFVVTNQSGIARGFYDEAAVESLHRWMVGELAAAGGRVDAVRYCPFHPEAKLAAYRQVHRWRKPQPGMIVDLMQEWSLDPARCVMVGDRATDMQAAEAAGIRGVLFTGGNLMEALAAHLLPTDPQNSLR